MRRQLRLLALLLVVALASTGLVTASAQAATATRVTGKVVDADGNPIRGITVLGFPRGDSSDVIYASTNSAGVFTTGHNERFSTGEFELAYFDAGKDYAGTSVDVVLHAGTNTLPDVTLQLGAKVTGTITSPSGHALRNIDLRAEETSGQSDDPTGAGYDTTGSTGYFELAPLPVGEYDLYTGFEPEDSDGTDSFVVTTPGEALQVDLANVRVDPRFTLKATSSSKGRATVKLGISAAYYGLPALGGTFDLYDGSKRIKRDVYLKSGARTISLSGLSTVKHTFRVRYLGSTDVLASWSPKVSVTVKK